MQKYIRSLLLSALLFIFQVQAQQTDTLPQLRSNVARIYYSVGNEQRCIVMSKRIELAMAYFSELLSFTPTVTVMFLNERDWGLHTSLGVVYGMPHYNPANRTLYVAAEDNPFWKSFIPPLDQLPVPLADQIRKVYKNAAGEISMQAFFDLLVIHELGHAYHYQYNLLMQRKWMGELYVNILLHTYVAEKEPDLLPALTVFPQMVIAAGTKTFSFTTLKDIEDKYEEIGRDHSRNYGWYQCRWHHAAATIYDAAGKEISRKIWNVLDYQKEELSDEALLAFLRNHTDKSLTAMVENW